MKKSEIKHRLLDECIKLQQKSIRVAHTAMEEAKESAGETSELSNYYDPYRSQMISRKEMYGKQFEIAQNDMDRLEQINLEKECDEVRFGSVIVTEDEKLFISIGLGKIEMGTEVYYAISSRVPLYKAMKYAKKGEVINFRGRKIRIQDVF